jgi:hypothetical protein
MKNGTVAALALGAFALWIIAQGSRSSPTYTGAPMLRDIGWNYPPVYPNVTGSGAVDPLATWPGWIGTPPYAGWPGQQPGPWYGVE